jgi:hypothetical protein
VRILVPTVVGLMAATTCCCCGSLRDWLDSFRPGEPTVIATTTTEPAAHATPARERKAALPQRVLRGQLLGFPDFAGAELVSYGETATIASASLKVDDAHPPAEVVAFYRQAALDKGYFIDSEIKKGREPSFQAIRGNVSFRVVAHDAGEMVEFSLTTERTL